jgi:hypothetical protein
LKQNDSIFHHILEMDDLPQGESQYQAYSSDRNWWPSHLEHNFQSLSLTKHKNILDSADSSLDCREADPSFQASQILWSTGSLSTSIPNGFYSIIPVSKWIFCMTFDLSKDTDTLLLHFISLVCFEICRKGDSRSVSTLFLFLMIFIPLE